jgi:hypothetical protein
MFMDARVERLSGDADLAKSEWQSRDADLYNYLWTTVLW